MSDIITEKNNFTSVNGVHKISYMIISPSEKPQAVLQFCHGMAEHKERYKKFGEFLAKNGIAFCIHDHLGHGESVNSDDELGFFAEDEGYLNLPNDMHRFTDILRKKYCDIPFFVGGHSMGSFVTRAYLLLYKEDKIRGAVIVGSGDSSPLTKAGVPVAGIIGAIKGKKHRSKLLDRLSFGNYNSKIEGAKTESDWLSRDEDEVKKYISDPYCGFIFTAAAFKDVAKLISFSTGKKWAKSLNKDCPLFFVSGGDDPVGGYSKGISKSYRQVKDAGVKNAELKLYQGGRHEILNETNKEEVRLDILAWIKKWI